MAPVGGVVDDGPLQSSYMPAILEVGSRGRVGGMDEWFSSGE